jgi:hypothetical protein
MTALPHPPAFVRPARFSADEWEARVQLAAAYRIFDHLGWTELIYNHISLRVPDEHGHYLINPFGLHYSEVCASISKGGSSATPTGRSTRRGSPSTAPSTRPCLTLIA